jgi:hypothetical protein
MKWGNKIKQIECIGTAPIICQKAKSVRAAQDLGGHIEGIFPIKRKAEAQCASAFFIIDLIFLDTGLRRYDEVLSSPSLNPSPQVRDITAAQSSHPT